MHAHHGGCDDGWWCFPSYWTPGKDWARKAAKRSTRRIVGAASCSPCRSRVPIRSWGRRSGTRRWTNRTRTSACRCSTDSRLRPKSRSRWCSRSAGSGCWTSRPFQTCIENSCTVFGGENDCVRLRRVRLTNTEWAGNSIGNRTEPLRRTFRDIRPLTYHAPTSFHTASSVGYVTFWREGLISRRFAFHEKATTPTPPFTRGSFVFGWTTFAERTDSKV